MPRRKDRCPEGRGRAQERVVKEQGPAVREEEPHTAAREAEQDLTSPVEVAAELPRDWAWLAAWVPEERAREWGQAVAQVPELV